MKPTYLIPLLLALPVTAYSAPHPVQQAAPAATTAKKTAKQLEQNVETALKKGDAAAYEKAAQALYDHVNGIMAAAYDPILNFQPPSDPSLVIVKKEPGMDTKPAEAVVAKLQSMNATQQAWLAFREAEDAAILYPWNGDGTDYLDRRSKSISEQGDRNLFKAVRILERLRFARAVKAQYDDSTENTPYPYLPFSENEPLDKFLNNPDTQKASDQDNMAWKNSIGLNALYESTRLQRYFSFYLHGGIWAAVTKEKHAAIQQLWEKYRDCLLHEHRAHPAYLQRITGLNQLCDETGLSKQRSHDILQYMGVLPYPKELENGLIDYAPAPWPFETAASNPPAGNKP